MSIEGQGQFFTVAEGPSVNTFKMYISAAKGLIATKFYLKHHWGCGLTEFGFWPVRTGTLVSMATYSSHGVIMGKHK